MVKSVTCLSLALLLCLTGATAAFAEKPRLVFDVGHSGFVRRIVFFADSKRYVSAGADGSVKVWDKNSQLEIFTCKERLLLANALAVSPDGSLIAGANSEGIVIVWNAKDGSVVYKHTCSSGVNAISFSDCKRVLYASWSGEVGRLDCNRRIVQCLRKPLGQFIRFSAFNRSGTMLAEINSGPIELFRLSSSAVQKKAYKTLTEQYGPIRFSATGKGLWCYQSGHLILASIADGHRMWRDGEPTNYSSAFSSNDEFAAMSGDTKAGTIRLISLLEQDRIQRIRVINEKTNKHAQLGCLALNVDGSLIAMDIGDGRPHVLPVPRKISSKLIDVPIEECSSRLDLTSISNVESDQSIYFAASGSLAKLDLLSGRVAKLGSSDLGLKSIETIRNSEMIFCNQNSGGTIIGVRKKDGSLLRLEGHARTPRMALSPDGIILVSASLDKTIRFWDTTKGAELSKWRLDTPSTDKLQILGGELENFFRCAVKFRPDGKQLACAVSDGSVFVIDAATGKLKKVFEKKNCQALSYDPSGKYLAIGGRSTKLTIYDAETLESKAVLEGFTAAVSCLQFYPDSTRLAVGDAAGRIAVWDIGTKKELNNWNAHFDEVRGMSILKQNDTETLITAADDGLKFWDSGNGDLRCSEIFLDNGDWGVVAPDGRFDGTDEAMANMHWIISGEPVALYQLKNRFFLPGLLKCKLGFDAEPPVEARLEEVAAIPQVQITEIDENDKNRVRVTVSDRGGGIGKIGVLLNFKEIIKDARERASKTDKGLTFDVDVSRYRTLSRSKQNTLTVYAFDGNNHVSSRGQECSFAPDPAAALQPTHVYIIACGVPSYPNDESLKLNFSKSDAESFAESVKLAAETLYDTERKGDKVFCKVLSSEVKDLSPSKTNIRQAFAEFAKAGPDDILIVYLSGHGVSRKVGGEDCYFYLTSQASAIDLDDPVKRQDETLSSEELADLTNANPSHHQVLILDTCEAGSALNSFFRNRSIEAEKVLAMQRLKDRTGFHVIMGSATKAPGIESAMFGGGLLTQALLREMGAKARSDSRIDVQSLLQNAADQVPIMAKEIQRDQLPVIASPRGNSFDIGKIHPDKAGDIKLGVPTTFIAQPIFLNKDSAVDDCDFSKALRNFFQSSNLLEERRNSKEAFAYTDMAQGNNVARVTGIYSISGDRVRVSWVLSKNKKMILKKETSGSSLDLNSICNEIVVCVLDALAQAAGRAVFELK